MKIDHHGALRTITLNITDTNDIPFLLNFNPQYKGQTITKVRTISFLVGPIENDSGNQLLLDDLEVTYDGTKNPNN